MIRKFMTSDRVGVKSKLAQKYDKTAESEVISWIHKLTEVKLEPGIYKLARQLKNGQTLVKLAQKVQEGTPQCPEAAKDFFLKLNTENAPFKQMENIQVFLGFCERYGVPVSGLFHTKDLFDGNNMQQVLACVIQLGTESQRNNFDGPTIGPKPQEKNIRDFSDETLKASHSFLAMQGGKGGKALDFQMGAARRIVDSRTEGAKTGKNQDTVNGVPDLLDIGKKGKKKDGESEDEEKTEKKTEKNEKKISKKKEKKELEKTESKKEESEKESSGDEKPNKDPSPAPPLKSKPKKKEGEKGTESKSRRKERTEEREEAEKKTKKDKKKKSSDSEEDEEE